MRPSLTGFVLLLSACTAAGPAPASVDEVPAGPVLAVGSLSEAGQAEARELYEAALEAAERRRFAEADELASRVVEGYPTSAVSVGALELRAELRVAGGLEALEGEEPDLEAEALLGAAREDVERLLTVLPSEDERVPGLRLNLVRVLGGLGDPEAALAELSGLGPVPGDAIQDSALARSIVERASFEALRTALDAGGESFPYRSLVLVAYARANRIVGDEDEARRSAREALAAGVTGADSATAAALAEGRGLPRAVDGPVPLGVVLPLGGSPAFQRFSTDLQRGIEAAVHSWGMDDDVELIVLDDGGDVRTAGNLVRTAEAGGAVAVLGMLEDLTLSEAAAARVDVPLLSPTAYDVPPGSEHVFSLNAFDPGAAESLAQWAVDSGILRVAIVHASGGVSLDEARTFQEAFEARGGVVAARFPYTPGITFWESQLRQVKAVRPQALVLPVPPEDVPGMAPQVTFFGLDTLGIRVLGTGGWTDAQILADVDTRHTDGVVVATPIRPRPGDPGYERFREAYESLFQEGLVEAAVPALGYDAASLVLQGIYAGAGSVDEVSLALESVTGFQGATGTLSVSNGVVTRAHEVLCLQDRRGTALRGGDLPAQRYRAYQMEDDSIPPPPGPGQPNGFECTRFQAPPVLDSLGFPVVDSLGFPVLDTLRLRLPFEGEDPILLPDTAGVAAQADTQAETRADNGGADR